MSNPLIDRPVPIMGHLVLGYPTLAGSRELANKYLEAGVQLLELQIPFSDPTADGPRITQANREALESGADWDTCLLQIRNLRATYPHIPILPMTYANKLLARGIQQAGREFAALGTTDLIVPDLPLDSPQAIALHQQSKLKLVPVLSPNVPSERLPLLLAHAPNYVYVMANPQTTGQAFHQHPALYDFLATLRGLTSAKLCVGFGIQTASDVAALRGHADVAVVGSALLRAQAENRLREVLEDLVGAAPVLA